MKRLIYQVRVGEDSPIYNPCITSVAQYCSRHGISHRLLLEPKLRIAPLASRRSENALRLGYLPIYEKENAFVELERYDQVAIIDADVYLRPDARNIFDELEPGVAFAGVVEREMPITDKYRRKIGQYSKGQYGNLALEADFEWDGAGAEFFNMGVMVLTQELLPFLEGQTPEEFIRRPEFERFVNGEGAWRWSTDQTLLNYWIKKEQIPAQHLNWRWNALFGGVKPARIHEAHFVHFFLSSHLPKKGAEVGRLIKLIEAGATEFPGIKGRG